MPAKAIVLHSNDTVATALEALEAGGRVLVKVGEKTVKIELKSDIPLGHKFALRDMATGEAIVKYGEPIGRCTAPIVAGDHVHVHNLFSEGER